MNIRVSNIILKGYTSQLVKYSLITVIVSIVDIMVWAATLKNNERRQGLDRPGTCGASISVWTGGKET